MLIDTHCHLADADYDADRAEVLARAWAAGISRIVVIGASRESAGRALGFAADEPRLSVTAGVHPHDVQRDKQRGGATGGGHAALRTEELGVRSLEFVH